MIKITTITDPMQVKVGDKAYLKNCDFGFAVTEADADDEDSPIAVFNPLSGLNYLVSSSRFSHATREVDEPEWPDPHDLRLRVYLGADGVRYIYNPTREVDGVAWVVEGYSAWHSREVMEAYYRDALPLTELKLVPAKDDDDE